MGDSLYGCRYSCHFRLVAFPWSRHPLPCRQPNHARQEAALAWFALAAILSDTLRDSIRNGYERSVIETKDTDLQKVCYGLFVAIQDTANRHYQDDAQLYTPAVATQAVEQLRTRPNISAKF